MRIGFIGIGNMGTGIATNVLKAGHDLTVFDLNKKAAKTLLESGARWADSPRELAAFSDDIIFTCLPGPTEIEDVALGENGIIEGIKPDCVYIDLSTSSPDMARMLYKKFKEKAAHVMDAPLNDGPPDAMAGTVMLMASGDEEIYLRCKPVLDAIGGKVRYFGKIGSGSICKIVHNCLSFGIQTVVAEGFSLGMKAGIDPEALWWVISKAAVGKGALFHALMPDVYLPRKFEPAQFKLRLAYKDVALAAALGREYNVPMPLVNLTQQELLTALNKGWGDKDALIAMLLQEERAGIKDVEAKEVDAGDDLK